MVMICFFITLAATALMSYAASAHQQSLVNSKSIRKLLLHSESLPCFLVCNFWILAHSDTCGGDLY